MYLCPSFYIFCLQDCDMDDEDMKELLSDTRLLKKLKRGQISEEDFETQITSLPKSKNKTEGPPLDGSVTEAVWQKPWSQNGQCQKQRFK